MTARPVSKAAALAGLVLCAALSSCVATQKDVLDLSQQSDDVKTQIEELKKTVGSLQANQADLSVSIKRLREDLSAYTEIVKSSQGDMGKLSVKLDELGAQISGKVAALGQSINQAQQRNIEEQKAALAEQKAALAQAKRENGATDLFVTAEKRLEAKDFAQAAKGFEQYLEDFPKGELADVATYNLGLADYGLRSWEKAGRQFAIVLDKYPKSGQTPGARLHYAYCLINLKKSGDEAGAYLESIVADFPKSAEAKEAALVLKRLEAQKAKR
ncbi:MAG: tetratricopeptide repeat protein [Elusimicrobia bacterium]|nr:tetratricopeptide repeat protein [Elusimicrobiota bacterium]